MSPFYLTSFDIKNVLLQPSSFTRLKEESRKGHPSFTSAFGGYLPLLAIDGT